VERWVQRHWVVFRQQPMMNKDSLEFFRIQLKRCRPHW
jgi:hypothetical protein